jgi:hypothetical protein
MKRAFVLLPVVGVVSMVTWSGCGGSTSGDFASIDMDGGGAGSATSGGGGTAGTGGDTTGSGGGATTVDGGVSFNPGAIGGLVGGGSDGGIPAADAAIGGAIITPEVVDGCNSLCAKEATAHCPNQGTLADCIIGCRLILNNANCSSAANALFACEKNSPAACDGQGKATLTGCGVQELAGAACFLQNASDPTLNAPCMSYCANIGAAKCPNEDPAGCAIGCPAVGNYIPACNMYWKNYVTCASTAKITCGMDGKANAAGCGVQGLAYILCTAGGVLSTGDAGR